MTAIDDASAAVVQLEQDIAALKLQWMDTLDELLPFIRTETLDPMVAAMSPKMKSRFFHQARLMFLSFDESIAAMRAAGEDPSSMIALREWLYSQPFAVDPSLPLPEGEAARTMSAAETFERLLPHVKSRAVEGILDALPGRWRKGTLRRLLRGMRPGLPVILATCRAHGQDEEPWHILMAWEATQPSA